MALKIQDNKEIEQKIDIKIIIAIISIAIISFIGILSETALNIAYSLLINEFSVSAAVIQWLTTGYLLILAILIPISPFLVKKFKTKLLFQIAVIIFAIGTLFCSVAWNFSMLLIGRIIQAVGTSITLPLMINIVLEEVPIERRGYVMGVVGLVINFAPALGPVFGGLVIEYINWHWIFISLFPILMVSFILGSKYITEISKNEKIPIDIPSVLLSAIAFSGIVYGFSTSGNSSWLDPKVFCCIITGIISMAAFAYRQLHLERPLIHVSVFKYPMFSVGVLILMISMMIVLAGGFLLPLLLQKALGCSSSITALALLPGTLINGIMSPFTGKFLDKHGPKLLLSVGFILLSLSLFTFSFINSNFIMVIIIYTFYMLGASMLGMPSQTNGLNQLPAKYNADGSAIMNTLQQVSGAIGTALASSILTKNSVSYLQQFSDVTSDVMSQSVAFGTQKTFSIFLILSIIGLIMALFTRK